ncbi:hypothetical protein WKR88_29435, partial [Trinickia caryophylli]|uniref:hypothetical protein n=1 Tax=Trinickia caryophylli TaxID=28094 RepID=UPI0030BAB9C2
SKNSLTTGSLSFSDIENHSHYSANSAGVTIGGAGMGIVPMMPQFANGDENALTRGGGGAGSVGGVIRSNLRMTRAEARGGERLLTINQLSLVEIVTQTPF